MLTLSFKPTQCFFFAALLVVNVTLGELLEEGIYHITTDIIPLDIMDMGVSKNTGTPKWMVKIMVPNPIS